ncbi:MAG: phosphatase PAP2 family protein [Polyangiaceae bacterium]|nr:phosphatase PAP2 family protein [Polyangiaceae bacterium]
MEGFLTTASVVGMIVLEMAGTPDEPRWTGGILFDDAARDAIRARDPAVREAAWKAGDILYYTFPVIPVVVDSFIISFLVRRDDKAALNLVLVSGEAMAYSGVLSFLANAVAARERPDVTACLAAGKGMDSDCFAKVSRTDNFYSGHTAMASTSAGVVCATHSFMRLWGHPVADGFACGLASATAIATGVTRLVSDRHYASDVLAGSIIGFGIGFAVPTLLHFRVPGGSTTLIATPGAGPSTAGISVSGRF